MLANYKTFADLDCPDALTINSRRFDDERMHELYPMISFDLDNGATEQEIRHTYGVSRTMIRKVLRIRKNKKQGYFNPKAFFPFRKASSCGSSGSRGG